MNDNVTQFPGLHRHDQPGYFSLADLPQRESVAATAFGTGWLGLDQIFQFYPGQFVVCTGISHHGKSSFLFNVLARLARRHGTASFLYVPENESYIHSRFEKIFAGAPEFKWFREGQCFVQSAIPRSHHEPPHTLPWVLDQAVVAIERDQVEIVMIDPWNELDRAKPRDMLMTDYIGESLMLIKQFCRAMNVVVILVAHPTKAVLENGGRVPSLADIEGSMNWANKCDNGLIIARDPEGNTCRVISAKVREIGAGRVGMCRFYVDPDSGVFTPQVGGEI